MIEHVDRAAFEKRAKEASLSECKAMLTEIYDAKKSRGKMWDDATICKVERYETYIRKCLTFKGVITKKNQPEFNDFMRDLQGMRRR